MNKTLFLLFLSLFLGLMSCVPTAVSEVASSPTVRGTAIPIETPTVLRLTPISSSTSNSYATVTPIWLTPTATLSPTAVFTQVVPDIKEPTTIISSSAASFPEMWSQIFYSGSIFWTVPSSWWPVTDAVAPAITEGNLLYASSTIQLSPLLLSQSEPSFPEGLLLMTVQSVVAVPDPNEGQAVKIGAFSGWLQEEVNSDIFPYANRRTLFVEAYANRYALSLACVPPGEADAAETAVFMEMCDQIWQQMMSGFSVKPIGIAAECPEVTVPPDQITWRRVSSNWYRYSFDIPAHWLEQRGTTSDRLGFLDDPAIYDQPNSCPLPNGIMSVDFSVDPPGNFGTGKPDSAPDTAGYAETTIAGHPAWIQIVQDDELLWPLASGTSVYIKGEGLWYHFAVLCIPPTDADVAGQDAFKAQCQEVLGQILASFEIR